MFLHESVVVERKKNSGSYCITIQHIVYLVIKSGSGTDSDSKQKLMESSSLDEALKSEAPESLAQE